ncbi:MULTISPECIES: SDR family NAD(P)-dependent oxidoreductase [unclassified Bradyrhizobium]|uniref:type I polyketide synthase n=1 Tax=unclassified Bradyrhizobium TaxID=2631580 RepID=UPI002915D60C|nr:MULTISPECIES: SDR family NAD(P)-dependent oxidoreductase [unclassified Bradyrhizobium]
MGEPVEDMSIAIIGMAGRFPSAPSVDRLWEILRDGREGVTFYSDATLLNAGATASELNDPNYVKAAPILENATHFDAEYFGYSPREAELMDPQHRTFLECCVEALENAACSPDTFDGSIGVFGGCALNVYQYSLVENLAADLRSSSSLQSMFTHGNDKDFLTTRVSYKLNLRGPSVAIQTACSTSLVAVHFAVQSIISGECDVALAGGVSITRSYTPSGYRFSEGGIFSQDGHTRAFDSRATGTVFGDGLGVVVLKRLERALKDGDNIRAIIRGSAVNNDGSAKVGYSAPSVEGQASVVAEALAMADVPSDAINYIEAHGTGTRLGDAIELAALNRVFGAASRSESCGLGTAKSNIGHLNTAAGIAGLIKAVLALENELIPPTINFDTPNPNIDLANSPFYVVTKATNWPRGKQRRLAGVSSFGIGGTNVHIVIEEPPEAPTLEQVKSHHLLLISAKQGKSLETMAANLRDYLHTNRGVNFSDLAYTFATGRTFHRHCCAIVCNGVEQAELILQGGDPSRVHIGMRSGHHAPIVFMFPGQGSQYFNMGRQLYREYSIFRDEVDRCLEILRSAGMTRLRDILLPRPETEREVTALLARTEFAQPAIFIISYALARLWISLGVIPNAMIGHSLGELVAACLSGVFSLETALLTVLTRGQVMQSLPEGGMLAVHAGCAEIEPFLETSHAIAAINGPRSCVVSGPWEAISRLESTLRSRDVATSRLRTSHAFHSTMMEPAVAPFIEKLRQFGLARPTIPFISNVTGDWIEAAQATDAGYWGRHLASTVRFGDGLKAILQSHGGIMVEVGPGQTLTTLVLQYADKMSRKTDKAGDMIALPSISAHDRHAMDSQVFLSSCARAWLHGAPVDWKGLYRGEKRRKLPLPTYPFDRKEYSPKPRIRPSHAESNAQFAPPSTVATITWTRSGPINHVHEANWRTVLIFANRDAFGTELAKRLRADSEMLILVFPGEKWEVCDPLTVVISPTKADHFDRLREHLISLNVTIVRVIYAWSVLPRDIDENLSSSWLGHTFYGLTYFFETFGEHWASRQVETAVIAAGTQKVTGDEVITPLAATAIGPCLAAPIEYAHLPCRYIDVSYTDLSDDRISILVDCIVRDLAGQSSTQMVAYRDMDRWIPLVREVALKSEKLKSDPLRRQSVYLITGGLGALGTAIMRSIARREGSKFVLVSRSPMPAQSEWESILAAGPKKLARAIQAIQDVESAGSEVLILAADVSDLAQMRMAVDQARARFGAIHNLIHAAGASRVGLIMSKTKDEMDRVMAPKVSGTIVLNSLFGERELDQLILFSSMSSLIHGAGHVDYAAANAYLDAFGRRGGSCAKRTITINWDTWGEIGLAADVVSADAPERSLAPLRNDALTTAQGVEAFQCIMASDFSQVLVSNRMERWSNEVSAERPDLASRGELCDNGSLQNESTKRYHHPRPNQEVEYVAPRTNLESVVATHWSDVLQIAPIGVNDDFFELGGHSLLALQLIQLWRDHFDVSLEAKDVFRTTTVAGIAEIIESKLIEEVAQGD